VAQFAEDHYLDILTNNEDFKDKKYETALRRSFLDVDVELSSDRGRDYLVA
jgi:hypothetical protein